MIAVIDYGAGNLGSVYKAFKYIGKEVKITCDHKEILNAEAVVLPGVGAFRDIMVNLEKAKVVHIVKEVINMGKPFLGICLGLQVLFDCSEEGGHVNGLGIFEGEIKRIPANNGLKVPHIGWNRIRFKNNDCPLYKNLEDGLFVYFVHSYYLEAKNKSIVSAKTDYGITFDASIWKDNVFATQFHPEKSGKMGLRMLENFIDLI